MSRRTFCWALFLFYIVLINSSHAIASEDVSQAKWKVDGLGFLNNRSLKRQLDLIFHEPQSTFGASDIEDAALVLVSFLQTQGYLNAGATALLSNEDGTESEIEWDKNLDVFLPRDTAVTKVRFDMNKGPRFFYDLLEIEGAGVVSHEDVETFFYAQPLLFQGKESRVFTPALLTSGSGNLQSHLNTLGYLDAKVESEVLEIDEDVGAARARVVIEEGPLYVFRALTIDEGSRVDFETEIDVSESKGQPYSRFLMQDFVRSLRNRYHSNGYPEVAISPSLEKTGEKNGEVDVDLILKVESGPRVMVSEVAFEGSERTKPSLLKSRLTLRSGDPLDPSKLDESRLNLSRIGIFSKVAYEEERQAEDSRSIRFFLDERPTLSAEVLFGWGSYEQARVGVEVERINVLGLGHRARFRSIVSLKSALGEWRYLMPEFLGSRTAVSTKLFGLDREEVSFDRVEFGFDIAASRHIEMWDLDVDAVYTFQSLEARNIESTEDVGLEDGRAGSVELRLGRDRRDNPLNPRSGYRFFGRFEYAAEFMGGEVDYQREEIGISWHGEVSRGLYWHLGLSHGAIGSFSEPERQVPFVKLFFPGGENSIRGYQRGEASPVDEAGNVLGARSYVLANLELEQMLSESLSVVLFVDGLGASAKIEDYPFDETLASIGLGLRMKTFMGPVRFEYGANVNRRARDPAGTFHFSLGYPF